MTFRPRRRSVCRRSSGDAAQTKPSHCGFMRRAMLPVRDRRSRRYQVMTPSVGREPAGRQRSKPDYRGVPSVAFTIPPIVAVGPIEVHARKQGLKFRIQVQKAPGWFTAGGRAIAMLLQRPLRRTSRASWGIAARSLAERIIRTRGADVGIEAARGNPIAAQCLHATCVLRRPIRRYNHVFTRPTPEAVLVM